jgi:hypothetical protein
LANRKSTAKKSTAKKSTAKKSTAKKSTAKKRVTSTTRKPNIQNRYVIPEVPTRSNKKTSLIKFIDDNKNEISASENIEEQKSKNGKSKLIVFLFSVAILIGIAYSISNNSEIASLKDNQNSSPLPANKLDSNDSTSQNFSLRYLYNSTGISVNLNDAMSLGSVQSFELIAEYNNSEQINLGTYPGTTRTIQVIKSDTVGNSTFTSVASLSNGIKVTSEPIVIRGKFEKP